MLTNEPEVLSVLHKIINLTARQTGTDLTKLSRWLRCLFNLSLTYDEGTSLKCIEQVVQIATKQQGVSPSNFGPSPRSIIKPAQDNRVAVVPALNTPLPSSDPVKDELADDDIKAVDRYPTNELNWLATTAFNHGIDYFLQGDDKTCTEWAQRAFTLAQWIDDDGALRDLLMERYATLGLQGRDAQETAR